MANFVVQYDIESIYIFKFFRTKLTQYTHTHTHTHMTLYSLCLVTMLLVL